MSSLITHFESLQEPVRKGLEVNTPINVRPPVCVSDGTEEDRLSETDSLGFVDGSLSVPLPLGLGSFTPRSESGMSASDAGTLSDSTHALSQAQEVSKLRRKLLDNLKGRQRQCLRTLTPLRDLDVESAGSAGGGMRRAVTADSGAVLLYNPEANRTNREAAWSTLEASRASYQRLKADCESLKMNASFSHLEAQLHLAIKERDAALKEVEQLRAERDRIREEMDFSGSKIAETMRPSRRFLVVVVMLLMTLVGPLPAGLRKKNGTTDCKNFLGQQQR